MNEFPTYTLPDGGAPKLHKLPVETQNGALQLAFRLRQGRAKEPSVVLLHGLGCSQRSFAGIWRHSAFSHATVLTLDLPGFGDSDRSERFSYRLEDHASAVLLLLLELGLKNVHVMGHSMGGAVALLLAQQLRRQGLLAGWAGVESTLIAEDCGVSRVVAGMTPLRFEQEFFPDFKTRTPPLHRAYLALELAAPQAFYKTSDSLWSWARGDALFKELTDLDAPRLYLYGRRNKNLPVLARLEELEGVRRRAIPDSGHFPMNENPKLFYQEVCDFCCG